MNRDFAAEAAALPLHDFDYLMHEYLWRTFKPRMDGVNALELGCFRGHMTRMIRAEYPVVTVVDASEDCISAARSIGQHIECHLGTFEEVELAERFDAIFLIHTLEHLSEPKKVLTRCLEWLYPDGKLFVAVPNAHAASRRLAVHMGLVSHPEAVTLAEKAHGHQRTYTQESLRAELTRANLWVEEIGGVMYKPLANFQFDRALKDGIVDTNYLEACYRLGKEFPDQCASIYAVCSKGAQEA